MKNFKTEDMLDIYNREKQHLIDAISNGSDPYHFFSLSTIYKNIANSRMIVLRNILLKPFTIYFNCDIRSPKVKQLKEQNQCTVLFYHQKRRIQMRLKCAIKIHYKNKLTKKIWDNTPLQSRKCYMGEYKPSSTLKSWHPNVPIKYIDRDPSKKDSSLGYENFTHVALEVINTDILELHYDGHIRFRVNNKNKITFLAP